LGSDQIGLGKVGLGQNLIKLILVKLASVIGRHGAIVFSVAQKWGTAWDPLPALLECDRGRVCWDDFPQKEIALALMG
jgi:hypothetical protein